MEEHSVKRNISNIVQTCSASLLLYILAEISEFFILQMILNMFVYLQSTQKTNVFQRETFNDFLNASLFPQNSHLHSKRKVNTQKVLSILEIALLFKTFLKALKVATNLPNLF